MRWSTEVACWPNDQGKDLGLELGLGLGLGGSECTTFFFQNVVNQRGVPWVPWNPPFEGLPLRMLGKSAQK